MEVRGRSFARTRRALYVVLPFLALFVAGGSAEASNGLAFEGCAWIDHASATTHNYYKISVESAPVAKDPCADQAAYRVPEGECRVFKTAYEEGGLPAPPSGVRLYVYADAQSMTHGADGASWSTPIHTQVWNSGAAFHGQSVSLCATTNAQSGGTPAPGTFRVVLRVCNYVNPNADRCSAATAAVYDVNSDDGGLPGTGNTLAGRAQGGFVGGLKPASLTDSTSLTGGNQDQYVGGDAPTLRMVDARAISNTGVESIVMSLLPEGGGTALASVTSSTLATTANADATFPLITYGGTYPNSTNPTVRVAITSNSALLARPWTYFATAPTGATLTSSTQLDKPWGNVDVGLTLTCSTLRNPLTGGSGATLLMSSEPVQCQGGPTVSNARGPLPSGAFVRVFAVRETRPLGDTADAVACDTTASAGGAWSCEPRLRSTATPTSGRAYSVQVLQYSSAARTTNVAAGTLAGRFDASNALTTDLRTYKTTCNGQEESSFVISSDIIAIQEGVTRNARGEVWNVSTTYTRTYVNSDHVNDLPSDAAVSATGWSLCHTLAPEPPSSAYWYFNVTVDDGGGNIGFASRQLSLVSPFAASYDVGLLGAGRSFLPGAPASLVIQTLQRDPSSVLQPFDSDTPCYWKVTYVESDGRVADLVPVTTCAVRAPATAAWFANFTVPYPWPPGRAATFTASANMSGVTITREAPLAIESPLLGDPLTLAVGDVRLGEEAWITLHAAYDNGTARTGAASNITLHVMAPDGSWPVASANPVELTGPGGLAAGYYRLAFTPTMLGRHLVLANTTTALNEVRSAPAAPFSVTRDLYGLTEYAIARVNATAGVGGGAVDLSYTHDLLNRTAAANAELLLAVQDLLARNQNASASSAANWTAERFSDALAAATEPLATRALLLAVQETLLLNQNATASSASNWTAHLVNDAIAAATEPLATRSLLMAVQDALSQNQNGTTAPLLTRAEFTAWDTSAFAAVWASLNGTHATLGRIETDVAGVLTRVTYFGEGIFAVANGTLTAAEFQGWKVGEARPVWAVVNGTATQADLVYYGDGIWRAVNATGGDGGASGSAFASSEAPPDAFAEWRDGAWRDAWITLNGTLTAARFDEWDARKVDAAWELLNGTAREPTLRYFGSGIWLTANETAARVSSGPSPAPAPRTDTTSFDEWRRTDWPSAAFALHHALSREAFADWQAHEFRPAWAAVNRTATQASLTHYGDGLFRLASGALPAEAFHAWKEGEARPMWAVVNGTAREATLTRYGDGLLAVRGLSGDEFEGWRVGEWRNVTIVLDHLATGERVTYVDADPFAFGEAELLRPAAVASEEPPLLHTLASRVAIRDLVLFPALLISGGLAAVSVLPTPLAGGRKSRHLLLLSAVLLFVGFLVANGARG